MESLPVNNIEATPRYLDARQDGPPGRKPRKNDSSKQEPDDEERSEPEQPLLPDYLGTQVDLEV